MANLTDDDIRHLANLSKIELDDSDVAEYRQQLSKILAYVEQLGSANTVGLEPTSQVTGLNSVNRPDGDTADTMARSALLDQVPHTASSQIKVPKIL